MTIVSLASLATALFLMHHWFHNSKEAPPDAPSTKPETMGEALDGGATIRLVEPSDLSAAFSNSLLQICRADPNVAGVWLVWLSSSDGQSELLATLLLDNPNAHTVTEFVDRVNALGGPSCVAAIPDGPPAATAFYRRAD